MDLSFALPHEPQGQGLRVTQNAHSSLLIHAKKPLLVTFCDPTTETEVSFWTHKGTEWNGNRWTDRCDS